MKTISIYEKIRECIEKNGIVPENFVLEEREYKENELRFAPGALEGIFGHHTSGAGDAGDFPEKLKEYIRMSPGKAMELFEREDAGDAKIASVRKGIQKVILEHKEEYDAGGVLALAYFFAMNGTKVETVKFGLSLLALFDTGDMEEVCNALRILGCCEEFTDYVVSAAMGWPVEDRQELYYELARKLHGWGKINVVECMVADTPEKKEWILCHGCKNSVMNAYLGYVCAVKCDFMGRLKNGNLTEEEFRGAGEIMEGLLDEGPCEGLSAMEEPAELALLYLEECGKHPLTMDLVLQLADIREHFREKTEAPDVVNEPDETEAADDDNSWAVLAKVQELLIDIDLPNFLAENMIDKTHQCIRIAKEFGLDVSECLLDLMRDDFGKYYQFCYYLFEQERYVEDFFALCEREVKESDYPNEMGDSWGFGRERAKIGLDMIVQYLDRYPLCGKKMIRICLRSPITRWRNMAGKALFGWVKALGGTLADIEPELYHVVEDVASRECNEGTKEMWKQLLTES